MADFPYLPLWVGDYLRDTQHLDARESGAYLLLMFAAWTSPGCGLPQDDRSLARLARCTPREWQRIKAPVLAFWTLSTDGLFHQKRLDKVRDSVTAKSIRASQSAQARWLKSLETSHADALPAHNGRNASQSHNQIKNILSENHTVAARGAALAQKGSAPRAMTTVLSELAAKHRTRT